MRLLIYWKNSRKGQRTYQQDIWHKYQWIDQLSWKFLDELNKDLENTKPDIPELVQIGSGSIYVVNGAIKTDSKASEWNINTLLRSFWNAFGKTSACRMDYTQITGSSTSFLWFCSTQWLEDIQVCRMVCGYQIQHCIVCKNNMWETKLPNIQ